MTNAARWTGPLILVPMLVLAAVGLAGTARADAGPALAAFFGTYEGESMFPADEVGQRRLWVAVRPSGEDGFEVEWETTIEPTPSEEHTNRQSLDFRPSAANPRLYVAGRGGKDGGGGESGDGGGLDPLDGRPFAWARIAGRILTVNVLTVTETGDYVMQTYDRVRTDRGLTLSFVRVRNGTVEKLIWGSLDRVDD